MGMKRGRNLLGLAKEDLLSLNPDSVMRKLSSDEVLHVLETLGALWRFNYEAAERGEKPLHALLKSGAHSDMFFSSYEVLQHDNILQIFARQLAERIFESLRTNDVYVAGVPNGATTLGETVAEYLGTKHVSLEKVDGTIAPTGNWPDEAWVVLVEDVCSTGGVSLRECNLFEIATLEFRL